MPTCASHWLAGKAIALSDGQFDVLEFEPFEADESDILEQKICKTIKRFLVEHRPAHVPSVSPMLRVTGECRVQVCVSLSGGVDSMVVAKILQVTTVPLGTLIDAGAQESVWCPIRGAVCWVCVSAAR